MQFVIINGSVQRDNTSSIVSLAFAKALSNQEVSVHGLKSFSKLFVGEYINLSNTEGEQLDVLEAMSRADCLIFVVPTYYKSMPGVLKNFFDIIRDENVFTNKIVAIIANNFKNQDYGAQHAMQVIAGMSVFYDEPIYIVPEILIVHHENIDDSELKRFAKVIENYSHKKF